MSLFNKTTKKELMINNMLNVKDNNDILDSFTVMQNEIEVSFNTQVVAITSINRDDYAAAFAKGFADTYALHNSKVLIVDANLYNPVLKELIDNAGIETKKSNEEDNIIALNESVSLLSLAKATYPPEIYKGGTIHKIIEENKDKFDHFVILTPSIKEHKELVLLNDVVNSVILLTQRNITKRKDIFEAIRYCAYSKLPLAKTVVLK